MDGGTVAEQELDTLGVILPLPYRIAVILVLGVWAWGLNLHYLSILRIDVAALIKYANRGSASGPPQHLRVYRLAITISIPLVCSILSFWAITRGRSSAVRDWDILPQSYLFLITIIFIAPIQNFSRTGRYHLLGTLRRISVGGIAEAHEGRFGDILLADVLTSYAKVFGDFFISVCMFFSTSRSSTARPDRNCGGALLVPVVIAMPSLIRLRQCLIEYQRVRRSMYSTAGSGSPGWGGQHLANALKYSSAFPVIILSALQRGHDSSKIGISEAGLFRLWLLFVFINSFYSFYWDVAKDWDLNLFENFSKRNNPEYAWGLRRHTHFHSRNMYYAAILLDLVLRCTWSLKLSPHLDHFNDLEGGIFVMELLEIFRRWIWLFFRMETEWGNHRAGTFFNQPDESIVRVSRGPAFDDILLGDYHNGQGGDDYD